MTKDLNTTAFPSAQQQYKPWLWRCSVRINHKSLFQNSDIFTNHVDSFEIRHALLRLVYLVYDPPHETENRAINDWKYKG